MTQQYTGRNNVTISMLDSGSVPIVSQTEIGPMKTALSLRALRHRAQCRAAPVAKPQAPGGSSPHGLHRERLILHAVAGCFGRHREAEQRHVSVGMDCVGLVLLAKWTRAALAFALASFSVSRVHKELRSIQATLPCASRFGTTKNRE